MCRKVISLLSLILLLVLAVPALATDYYVSPSGDDGNSGTSPGEAWATIDKVNSTTFSPGDSILFEGGQTFSGSLSFTSGGTVASPITVSSYGSGRATISSGSDEGLYVYNCAGFDITELNFVGSGRTDPQGGHGVFLDTDRDTAPQLEYVHIDNVDVSGYRETGIFINSADRGNIGFKDVQITNTEVHDNGDKGIASSGWWPRPRGTYAHSDIYIGDCKIYTNPGIPGREPHTGNGVVLSSVDGAIIEFCEAYDNGELCDAPGGGPLGIWCWEATDVIMQFNEAHHNKTAGGDGGGFDVDGGGTYCVMQYNYSHDNHGCGYLICQFKRAASYDNNICRYNISENDSIASGGAMGAITFWSGGSGGIKNTQIINNTLYVSENSRGAVIEVWSGGISNTAVHNNIFMTVPGKQVLNFSSTSGGWNLQGNCYWSSGAAIDILWGSTTYTSLADFQAGTGQEMLDGQPVGFEADPCLTDAGGGGTVGDPHLLPALDAYKLLETSPLINGGLDTLTLFGIDPGT
ncbi:MAG: right-handed parallel beta-helix repeat-containing protein, partial [Planctomycetota bacterium]